MVIYYQDDAEPPQHAWRWKVVKNGTEVAISERTFKTRRGAMDDWNRVQLVLSRLERKTP